VHSATGWTLSIIDIIIFTLSLRVDQISASFVNNVRRQGRRLGGGRIFADALNRKVGQAG
jgi:hypothetical protein